MLQKFTQVDRHVHPEVHNLCTTGAQNYMGMHFFTTLQNTISFRVTMKAGRVSLLKVHIIVYTINCKVIEA